MYELFHGQRPSQGKWQDVRLKTK